MMSSQQLYLAQQFDGYNTPVADWFRCFDRIIEYHLKTEDEDIILYWLEAHITGAALLHFRANITETTTYRSLKASFLSHFEVKAITSNNDSSRVKSTADNSASCPKASALTTTDTANISHNISHNISQKSNRKHPNRVQNRNHRISNEWSTRDNSAGQSVCCSNKGIAAHHTYRECSNIPKSTSQTSTTPTTDSPITATLDSTTEHIPQLHQKCSFTSVGRFGISVAKVRASIAQSKVVAIARYPITTDVNELQAFLGLQHQPRRCVPNLPLLAGPITQTQQSSAQQISTATEQLADALEIDFVYKACIPYEPSYAERAYRADQYKRSNQLPFISRIRISYTNNQSSEVLQNSRIQSLYTCSRFWTSTEQHRLQFSESKPIDSSPRCLQSTDSIIADTSTQAPNCDFAAESTKINSINSLDMQHKNKSVILINNSSNSAEVVYRYDNDNQQRVVYQNKFSKNLFQNSIIVDISNQHHISAHYLRTNSLSEELKNLLIAGTQTKPIAQTNLNSSTASRTAVDFNNQTNCCVTGYTIAFLLCSADKVNTRADLSYNRKTAVKSNDGFSTLQTVTHPKRTHQDSYIPQVYRTTRRMTPEHTVQSFRRSHIYQPIDPGIHFSQFTYFRIWKKFGRRGMCRSTVNFTQPKLHYCTRNGASSLPSTYSAYSSHISGRSLTNCMYSQLVTNTAYKARYSLSTSQSLTSLQ